MPDPTPEPELGFIPTILIAAAGFLLWMLAGAFQVATGPLRTPEDPGRGQGRPPG